MNVTRFLILTFNFVELYLCGPNRVDRGPNFSYWKMLQIIHLKLALKLKMEKVAEKGREILAEKNTQKISDFFFHSFFHRPASSRREFWTSFPQNIASAGSRIGRGWSDRTWNCVMVGNSPTVKLVFCFFDVVCRCLFLSPWGGLVEHFFCWTLFSPCYWRSRFGLRSFWHVSFSMFPDGCSRGMRVMLCWILIQHPRFQPLETFRKGEKVHGEAK